MIDLVLDDLCGKAGVGLCFPLKTAVLIFDLDRLIPCGFARYSEERQAALFSFIRRGFFHQGISLVFLLSILQCFFVCIDRLPEYKKPIIKIFGHQIERHVQDRHKKTVPSAGFG